MDGGGIAFNLALLVTVPYLMRVSNYLSRLLDADISDLDSAISIVPEIENAVGEVNEFVQFFEEVKPVLGHKTGHLKKLNDFHFSVTKNIAKISNRAVKATMDTETDHNQKYCDIMGGNSFKRCQAAIRKAVFEDGTAGEELARSLSGQFGTKGWAVDLYKLIRADSGAKGSQTRNRIMKAATAMAIGLDPVETLTVCDRAPARRMLSNLALLQAMSRPLSVGEDRSSVIGRCKKGIESSGFPADNHVRNLALRIEAVAPASGGAPASAS